MLADKSREALRDARNNWYAKLGHVPKLGQRLFDQAVDAGKRFVGLFTPPQDGKSYHVAKHVGPYLLVPDTHIWVVGPTYQDACKEFGYLYQDLAHLGVLRGCRRKHFDIRGGNMHIETKFDSWIQVISAENPENLRREQLDVVILAEASKLSENLYDRYLYARVERRNGLVLCPTTHKGYGWVWDRFYVPSQPLKPGSWTWGRWVDGRREQVGGEPNPRYDPEVWSCQVSYVEDFGDVLHTTEYTAEQIAKARLRLPAPMFAEQFGGEAASYAGLIYWFDPLVHECDPFPIPREWRHICGWDHGAGGGSDPTAIEVGSYAPDGTLFWWGEIYDEQVRSVKERAGLLRVLLAGRPLSAPVMRGRDAKQVGTELAEAGFASSYPDASTVDARIIRKTALMRERKWKILRGACPHLKRQVLSNEWDERNPGKPKDGDDHAVEASGYAELAAVGHVLPLQADPDVVPGESPEVSRLWKDFRRSMREQEEARTLRHLDRLLDDDPYDVDDGRVHYIEAR